MSPASPSAAPPGTTPSVGELSAEFAKQKRAKSPPLAFEKTSNDSLGTGDIQDDTGGIAAAASSMGRLSLLQSGRENDLQRVVDRQAAALQLLHNAFTAERLAWESEKEWLHQRIAKLENLLKTGDGNSPAKSPVLSPLNHSAITSPQSKSTTNRLPSIAEDEVLPSLSERRDNGRMSIDIPPLFTETEKSPPSVTFRDDTPTGVQIEEIPASPANLEVLSPPPFYNRQGAGHTPLRAPRPLTPPPQNSLSLDGIDDTPTRNNTQSNTLITKDDDDDGDKELKGPLNMPELPNKPSEGTFTLEALSKKLELIERSPEERIPAIFHEPSPGVASPAAEPADGAEADKKPEENPFAPPATHRHESSTEMSSNALSSTALSPLSKHTSREEKVHSEFESGGIKLKAKTSMNFGLPFGQLGGFGRRISQDRE